LASCWNCLFNNAIDQRVHINVALGLGILLDAQIGQSNVAIHRRVDQVEDAQAAFDRAAVDDPIGALSSTL